MRAFVLIVLTGLLTAPAAFARAPEPLNVRMVTDEAETVLDILDGRRAGRAPRAADWDRLFATEGYRRLKERELSMGRPFEDEAFKAFVLSPELAMREARLRDTLRIWLRADVSGAAARALAYLPRGARLRAKIYPVIKPATNSFVFDLDGDPAIFLYLDPHTSSAKFENTIAHELHHVGFAAACPPPGVTEAMEKLAEPVRLALNRSRAFGEGLAMLAAAGGPEVHPHAASRREERDRWDRDVASFDRDLRLLEEFFESVLDGRLTGADERREAMKYYGEQGPWYTVGWRMAVTIERAFGRETLVRSACNPRDLLATYNRAATELNRTSGIRLALWSPEFLLRLVSP